MITISAFNKKFYIYPKPIIALLFKFAFLTASVFYLAGTLPLLTIVPFTAVGAIFWNNLKYKTANKLPFISFAYDFVVRGSFAKLINLPGKLTPVLRKLLKIASKNDKYIAYGFESVCRAAHIFVFAIPFLGLSTIGIPLQIGISVAAGAGFFALENKIFEKLNNGNVGEHANSLQFLKDKTYDLTTGYAHSDGYSIKFSDNPLKWIERSLNPLAGCLVIKN